MSIYNAAGTYVILDVNSPLGGESISRYDPESSYNEYYLNRVFGLVDAFQGYPNLLGFFAGNEVVNDAQSAQVSPPYMRAVIRDLKDYIKAHSSRPIPVGYSAADDTSLRQAMWEYLQCGGQDGDTSRADFYGLNSYQWCSGRDDWSTSGYGNLLSTFETTKIPVFLSEYGCNVNLPRTFDEVTEGVYGGLASTFSGGLVYEYFEEPNNYGLVEVGNDGSVRLLQDFENLKSAYASINLEPVAASQASDANYPACNSDLQSQIESSYSDFNASFALPTCPAPAILKNGVGNNNVGKIIELGSTATNLKIFNVDGEEVLDKNIVQGASGPSYSGAPVFSTVPSSSVPISESTEKHFSISTESSSSSASSFSSAAVSSAVSSIPISEPTALSPASTQSISTTSSSSSAVETPKISNSVPSVDSSSTSTQPVTIPASSIQFSSSNTNSATSDIATLITSASPTRSKTSTVSVTHLTIVSPQPHDLTRPGFESSVESTPLATPSPALSTSSSESLGVRMTFEFTELLTTTHSSTTSTVTFSATVPSVMDTSLSVDNRPTLTETAQVSTTHSSILTSVQVVQSSSSGRNQTAPVVMTGGARSGHLVALNIVIVLVGGLIGLV